MRFPQNHFGRRRQRGFTLLEVLLAIGVSLSIGAVALNELQRDNESKQAMAVGQQMATVGGALNTYLALHYSDIVSLTNVAGVGSAADPGPRTCTPNATTVNGVPAAICTVTTDTLIRSGLLPWSFSGRNAFGANYDYYIRVTGSAPTWLVDGLVVTSTPYTTGGGNRYDLLGQAMQVAGADSGMTRTLADTMEGLNGTWRDKDWPTITQGGQTYPGVSSLGLMGYRVGYGSSGFAAYLRLDGTTPMTGALQMDGHDIQKAGFVDAQGARLSNTGETLALGAANATDTDRTALVTGPGTFGIRNNNGVSIQNLNGTADGNLKTGGLTATANINANGDISAIGNIQAKDITATNNMAVGGQLSVGGNAVVGGNLGVTGNVTLGGTSTLTAYNVVAANEVQANGGNGLVTAGNTGWYNSTYDGGWYMSDATWIRARSNKSVYTAGNIRADTNVTGYGTVTAGSALTVAGANAAGVAQTVTQGTACAAGNLGTIKRATTGLLVQCANVGGTYSWRNLGIDSTVTVVSAPITSPGIGGGTVTRDAICPAGSRLVGGGYALGGFVPLGGGYDGNAPSQSYPNGDRWTIGVDQRTGNSTFTASAVCAY